MLTFIFLKRTIFPNSESTPRYFIPFPVVTNLSNEWGLVMEKNSQTPPAKPVASDSDKTCLNFKRLSYSPLLALAGTS